jgi:exonuclease III
MTKKTLTLASFNVRGLRGGTPKAREISLWLALLPSPLQIILLQEHYLDKDGIQAAAKGLDFWQGTSFWNEGIPVGRSRRIRAGMAILFEKSIAPLIAAHGTIIEGRAQYVSIQSPDNGTLTIYAPRSSDERSQIWRKINQDALPSDHYILGGDFNHLEASDLSDTIGTKKMGRRKLAAWHHMTLRLGLSDAWCLDSFRKLSKKEFTYDNGRSGAASAISRIDKFMISQSLEERGGHIETAISVRKLSDHSSLIFTIWGHPSAPNTPSHYFDIALLKDDNCKKEMGEAWVGPSPPPPTARTGRPGWRPPQNGS